MTAKAERIKEARKSRFSSQEELAEAMKARGAKLTRGAVGNWERGGGITTDNLVLLAELTGYRVEYLASGMLPKFPSGGPAEQVDASGDGGSPDGEQPPPNARWAPDVPPPPNRQSMPLDVPVLGVGAAGTATARDMGEFELNGQIVDYVRRPPRLIGRSDVFALYVHGDSVSPWREPGQLIYVESLRPPKPLDYVVVKMKPKYSLGETRPALIKRLLATTPTKVRLRQYNPPQDFDLDRDKILKVFRIMDWDELMGV